MEDFSSLQHNLPQPSLLEPNADIHLFKDGAPGRGQPRMRLAGSVRWLRARAAGVSAPLGHSDLESGAELEINS